MSSTSGDEPLFVAPGGGRSNPNTPARSTGGTRGGGNVKKFKMDADSSSDDSGDDVPLSVRRMPQKPKAASGKSRPMLDSDSSDSDDDRPLFVNSRTPGKKKNNKFLSDSSDEETLRIPKPRRDSPAGTKYSTGGRKRKAGPMESKSKRAKMSSYSSPKRTPSRSSPSKSPRGGRILDARTYPKKETVVPLQSEKNATRWWDREPYKGDKKWTTLDHNGVVFPPPYQQHHAKLLYNGKPLDLTGEQEEMATFYAQMLETEWVKKKTFNMNFFKEFRKMLVAPDSEIKHPECTHFSKFNFRPIYDWCMKKKEEDKLLRKTKKYKTKTKAEREQANELYGFAVVDAVREKVGNFKVEPPGLFRGRGDHPKMGLLKKRLRPEQITLNIGHGVPIPPCPIPGHNWGGVVHDQSVTYIAKWIENINGQHKFVYLHASSRFKGQSDLSKYEKARELKKHVKRIRADYGKKLTSRNLQDQQLATCIYIIDKLSIRVGNEKDTDEEADTVGVCSFRVEHLKDFKKDNKGKYHVTLDFLGKDSMRYLNTVEIPKQIYKNLKAFHNKPSPDSPIFEHVDPGQVNEYLKSMMPGLSAKVFRTHNASTTLCAELRKTKKFQFADRVDDVTDESPIHEKKYFYDTANKTVAILCNHKKTVNKEAFEKSEGKMMEKINKCNGDVLALKRRLKISQGRMAPTNRDDQKWVRKDPKMVQKQLKKKEQQLAKLKMDKQLKIENKEVALGTSKINYNDPRITVAFAKRMELPIEKVFNKALLDKFPWAMAADPSFVF